MIKIMNKQIIIYIIVSFGFSWAVALITYLNGGFQVFGKLAILPAYAYMCGPAVGALVCAYAYEKGRRVKALGVTGPINKYLPIAWAIALSILVIALLISWAGPGISPADPVQSNIALIDQMDLSEADKSMAMSQLEWPFMGVVLFFASIFLGPLINWPLMLSEELGWRGYLWDQLKTKGFWAASWITGGLWGVWHVPIILMGHNYPKMPVLGSLLFIGLCLLMGPVYSWIRLKSGSVWGPCLLHGTTNGAAGYFLLAQSSMDMPWKGLLGIGGFIALGLTVLIIWACYRKTPLTITD